MKPAAPVTITVMGQTAVVGGSSVGSVGMVGGCGGPSCAWALGASHTPVAVLRASSSRAPMSTRRASVEHSRCSAEVSPIQAAMMAR